MSLLAEALRRLEDQMRRNGAPVLQRLRPGVPADDCAATLKDFVGAAPEELVTWFSWANGVNTQDSRRFELCVINAWRPLSLGESRDEAMRWARMYEERPEWGYDRWEPAWVPIVVREDVGFLVADTARASQGVPVRLHSWDGDPDKDVAASIAEVVSVWCELLETGAVYWDSKRGYWTTRRPEGLDRVREVALRGLL